MTKDQRRSLTKKALLDALVICLKDQDFNEITTIRLVQTAGISRSSFYTHYKDKFEMIDSYQKELFHKLEYIFDKYEGKKEGAFLEIFEILTREKLLSALLSTNGAKEIQDFLINKLQRMIAKDFIDPTAEKRALKGQHLSCSCYFWSLSSMDKKWQKGITSRNDRLPSTIYSTIK